MEILAQVMSTSVRTGSRQGKRYKDLVRLLGNVSITDRVGAYQEHERRHGEHHDGTALQAVHQLLRRQLPKERDSQTHDKHCNPVIRPAL